MRLKQSLGEKGDAGGWTTPTGKPIQLPDFLLHSVQGLLGSPSPESSTLPNPTSH